jgi:hypothetical protein
MVPWVKGNNFCVKDQTFRGLETPRDGGEERSHDCFTVSECLRKLEEEDYRCIHAGFRPVGLRGPVWSATYFFSYSILS